MKKIISIFLLSIITMSSIAQTSLATIKSELTLLNKSYDSARYFGFDVAMRFHTDTVFGKFETDALQGTYILNGKNIYYKIGETEYLQNDSLSLLIMNDDKQVMVSKNVVQNNADLFPLKNFTDSILDSVSVYYTMALQTLNADEKQITLDLNNDTLPAPYTNISIVYDAQSYLIKEMIIKTRKHSDDLELIRPVNPYFKATVTMLFANYHNENNAKELQQSEYIYYNPLYNTYSLAPRYTGYALNLMGIEEGTGEKKYIEQ